MSIKRDIIMFAILFLCLGLGTLLQPYIFPVEASDLSGATIQEIIIDEEDTTTPPASGNSQTQNPQTPPTNVVQTKLLTPIITFMSFENPSDGSPKITLSWTHDYNAKYQIQINSGITIVNTTHIIKETGYTRGACYSIRKENSIDIIEIYFDANDDFQFTLTAIPLNTTTHTQSDNTTYTRAHD